MLWISVLLALNFLLETVSADKFQKIEHDLLISSSYNGSIF